MGRVNAPISNPPATSTAANRGIFEVKPHKYFVFTRSAASESELSFARKLYKFYTTEEEARSQFEQEPPCGMGEHYEAGWGFLSLTHGMTDWRRVEVSDLRKGVR